MGDDLAGFKFQVSSFKLEFQVSQAERRLGYALAIMSHTLGATIVRALKHAMGNEIDKSAPLLTRGLLPELAC